MKRIRYVSCCLSKAGRRPPFPASLFMVSSFSLGVGTGSTTWLSCRCFGPGSVHRYQLPEPTHYIWPNIRFAPNNSKRGFKPLDFGATYPQQKQVHSYQTYATHIFSHPAITLKKQKTISLQGSFVSCHRCFQRGYTMDPSPVLIWKLVLAGIVHQGAEGHI